MGSLATHFLKEIFRFVPSSKHFTKHCYDGSLCLHSHRLGPRPGICYPVNGIISEQIRTLLTFQLSSYRMKHLLSLPNVASRRQYSHLCLLHKICHHCSRLRQGLLSLPSLKLASSHRTLTRFVILSFPALL